MSASTAIPPYVIGAVLGAALLHAGWNAALKRRGEPLLATVLVVAGAALAAAILLPLLPLPDRASWPFIAASTACRRRTTCS